MHRLVLAAVACIAGGCGAADAAEDGVRDVVSESGVISLPADFRARFRHLGSWFVPEGDASGFHDVYANPAAIAAYRETGEFPDGSVLVKELRGAAAGAYTTGEGVRFATDELKQWFVMVKDSRGRFPDNQSWGDGWGWALFKPEDLSVNVSSDYRTDCLGCHLPARASDLVYVEAYPTLKADGAEGAGAGG
jgi:hypothetical protein